MSYFATALPVIYVADVHPEYGTLGLQLNRLSNRTMSDLFPGLQSFRQRPLYMGGKKNCGAAFSMIHQKVGFPENRAWKGLAHNEDFRIFFSPDVAMANELCSTNDATPSDFKFFQWATVWKPRQLELEWERKLWLSVQGPVDILFDDCCPAEFPLWRRIVASLPTDAAGNIPLK